VKDLDVWTFYAAMPGRGWQCGQYETHADFGPSTHGRQAYPRGFMHPQLARWLAYEGRRVDFMVRDLNLDLDADINEITDALRMWLPKGRRAKPDKHRNTRRLGTSVEGDDLAGAGRAWFRHMADRLRPVPPGLQCFAARRQFRFAR
jgi:hypothetical protein